MSMLKYNQIAKYNILQIHCFKINRLNKLVLVINLDNVLFIDLRISFVCIIILAKNDK